MTDVTKSPPWLEEFRRTLSLLDGPGLMVLATLSRQQTPRARTVILREVEADGTLLVCSHGGSEKNDQLRHRPVYEAVVWIGPAQTQWRLRGRAEVLGESAGESGQRARRQVWQGLSDDGRGMFPGPPPGREMPEQLRWDPVPVEAAVPASFEVLRLHVSEADRLELSVKPHRRVQWRRDAEGWGMRRVTP